MTGFLCAVTLLLATGLIAAPAAGRKARRLLELAALLVAVLPLLLWLANRSGIMVESLPALSTEFCWDEAQWPGLGLLKALWLMGVVVGFVKLGCSWAALRQWRRTAAALPAPLAAGIARVLQAPLASVRRHFRLSRFDHGPALLPAIPGIILLPRDWQHWPARLQTSALRHEWHHLRQGDAWWNVLLRVLVIALWWHPLVWALHRRWRDECERLADLAACAGGERETYASDLLHWVVDARSPVLAASFAGASPLRRRLTLLLRGGKNDGRGSKWMVAGAVILTALALSAVLMLQDRQRKKTRLEDVRLRLTAEAFPAAD